MSLRVLVIIPLLLVSSVIVMSQTPESVDALKYFDENKRWYNEFTEHWFYFHDIPEADIRESIVHWEKIGSDIKNSTSLVEGIYANGGDTHGDYLQWSEKSGFVWLKVNKCGGGPMKIIRGKVVVTPSWVKFVPEIEFGSASGHANHGSRVNSREFLVVKWREVTYLVDSDSITNFADYTAGLNPETSGLYDEGRYFSNMRQIDFGSANELPKFPPGYEQYVKRPFRTKVTSIAKAFRRAKPIENDEAGRPYEETRDHLLTTVRVPLGDRSGIKPGVLLRFINEEDDYRIDGVRITKVLKTYSIGEYVTDIPKRNCKKSDIEDCEPEQRRRLFLGQRLSTTGIW